MSADGAILDVRALDVRVGTRSLVTALSLPVRAGTFTAVLGRNGSGKTILLHTLAGLREPHAGQIGLDGQNLAALRRREIARHIGLLPQDPEIAQSTPVLDAVLVGRHPHLEAWQWEREADHAAALDALRAVGLVELAARQTATLSGGEQRRVAMATLLAQSPRVHILDEPTNHLDPGQQIEMLELFGARCAAGCAVLASLHDPSLAARHADRALLLYGDGRWAEGPIAEMLTPERLSALYGTTIGMTTVADRRIFYPA